MSAKTCTNGKDCKHPNGPDLTLAEFYDYRADGGRLFSRCKACCREDVRRRELAEKRIDHAERITLIKSYRQNRRADILFRWCQDRVITREEFRMIYLELTCKCKVKKTKS